jgi:hypothetical protein
MNWETGNIRDDIEIELGMATAQYPPFHSFHEGYAVLLEEVDELWDTIKGNRTENMYREAIQVAAMAIRFLRDCADYEV